MVCQYLEHSSKLPLDITAVCMQLRPIRSAQLASHCTLRSPDTYPVNPNEYRQASQTCDLRRHTRNGQLSLTVAPVLKQQGCLQRLGQRRVCGGKPLSVCVDHELLHALVRELV